MFIDMNVSPAFYETINQDEHQEALRHDELNIHKNGTAKIEHIFNQMACAKLDRLCLLPEDYSSIHGSPLVTNEEVARLVEGYPKRFIGFASTDPLEVDYLEKAEKAFADLKLKGLKLNLNRLQIYPTDQRLNPLYDLCEKYNKPVIFHSGLSWEPQTLSKYSRPLEFEEVAYRRPKLRICLTQFGWPWVRETAMLMQKYKNVYADTGALYFDNAQEFFTQMFTKDIPCTWIDRSLRHQIMFGSANPRFEQIRMAEALTKLNLREDTIELIKGENALEFMGWEGEDW
ncbi:putative TIM-barrel fold metal-dependent hydrolase [Lachnospiraceae bacterium PF1-21]|uniref:amidohydrolase family protein n=1 Tax=Ohessyouella blattaphilus TaxID=2949333 RepID=UPI002563210D|nr:amidohydrolase family protein [Lachnospiraceae bacterium OttesenSCG-928-J05]